LPYKHPLIKIIKNRTYNGGDMVKENFGKRVKQLRNERGLSQEKFALIIDMDRTYLASVESGKRNISINNIEKIANGLGVSLEELFKDM
jgi:transcriptional regulator with XRE-family HTH domain